MHPINSINIRILGIFNPRKITSSWINKFLCVGELSADQVKISVNVEDKTLRYQFKGIDFFPSENFIDIFLIKKDSSTIHFAAQILQRLLTLMPFTPIKALGINVTLVVDREKALEIPYFSPFFASEEDDTVGFINECRYVIAVEESHVEYLLIKSAKKEDQEVFESTFNLHYDYSSETKFSHSMLKNHITHSQSFFYAK